MLVSELAEKVESTPSVPITTALCEVEIVDGEVKAPGLENYPLAFDSATQELFADFVGKGSLYLKKCPSDLAAYNLNHWMQNSDRSVTLQTLGNELLGLSDPDQKSMPLPRYVQTVVDVFQPFDEVVKFGFEKNTLHIDVITGATVEVPGDGSERRPAVGDVTHGGLRLLAYPDAEKPPMVSTYMHRLVCTNGLTVIDPANKISLRSKSVDDIFTELVSTMESELSVLHQRLQAYADTANTPIHGDRSLLIFNLAAERNLPRKIIERVMDLGSELPVDATVYDVLNVFTEVAKSQPRSGNLYKLQEIGGALASPHSNILHRCQTCEHPLTNYDLV